MNTPTLTAPYTLTAFRAFFSAIPDSLWCSHTGQNAAGQRCAIGLVMDRREGLLYTNDAYHVLKGSWLDGSGGLFAPLSDLMVGPDGGLYAMAAAINNGYHAAYQQSTPRARILAAIDDLIAMDEAKRGPELEALEVRPLVGLAQVAAVEVMS